MFTFYIKLWIWSFHVVALQRTAKKCTKICIARAKSLFCQSNLLFCDVLVSRRRRVCVSSLMFPSAPPRETLRFSGNKINCFPRDQSLSVKCYSGSSQLLLLFFISLLLAIFCLFSASNHLWLRNSKRRSLRKSLEITFKKSNFLPWSDPTISAHMNSAVSHWTLNDMLVHKYLYPQFKKSNFLPWSDPTISAHMNSAVSHWTQRIKDVFPVPFRKIKSQMFYASGKTWY